MSPMSSNQFWPYEAPAGLGPWGRQTDHRLSTAEDRAEQSSTEDLEQRVAELEEKVRKLEQARPTGAPSLLESQNVRLLLWLIVAGLSLAVTGKLPDLSAVLPK